MAKGDTTTSLFGNTQERVGTGGVSGSRLSTPSTAKPSGTTKPPLSFEQAYPAAIEQTGEDYSNIMGGYQKLLDSGGSNNGLVQNYQSILNRNKSTPQLAAPNTVNASQLSTPNNIATSQLNAPTNVTASQSTTSQLNAPSNIAASRLNAPANVTASRLTAPANITAEQQQYGADAILQKYIRNADVTKSLAGLEELSNTGGYSEQGIADLRARGVSPIRSAYANSMREMDRNKSLQGGYSPNFNAATSRMTREQADLISGATQNVNAGIAQNVASNRLSAAPLYAGAAANESNVEKGIDAANVTAQNRSGELRSGIDATNTAARNRTNELNASNIMDTNKTNAEIENTINQLNAAAVNRANEYNATNESDTNRFNAGNINETNRINAAAQNRTNELNAQAIADADRFNTSGRAETDRLNAASAAEADRFNAQATARTNELNAASESDTNRFNAQGIAETNRLNNANAIAGNQFNSGLDLQTLEALRNLTETNQGNQLQALGGMQSLYGTTPALAATFGNQAATAAQIEQGATQANNSTGLDLIGATTRARSSGSGGGGITSSSGAFNTKPVTTTGFNPLDFSMRGSNAPKILPPWAYGG